MASKYLSAKELAQLDKLETDQTARGVEERYNCPFCSDTKYHLYVNKTKGVFICFKCNASGAVQKQQTIEERLDQVEATLQRMSDGRIFYKGVPLFEDSTDRISREPERIEIVKTLPLNMKHHYVTDHHPAIRYLAGRWGKENVRPLMKLYNIRISAEKSGIFCNTIVFPIGYHGDSKDANEITILQYFVARKYELDTYQKYANAPWPKGDTLFVGRSKSRSAKYTKWPDLPMIICEGIFDAIAIEMAAPGAYNVVALLGKVATKDQMERLGRLYREAKRKPVSIYLDPDAEGYALTLAFNLAHEEGVTNIRVVKVSGDKDPGDSSPEEIRRTLRCASSHQL